MLRFWFSFALLIAAVVALWGRQVAGSGTYRSAPNAPAQFTTGPYTVSGTVVNGATGEPVGKAVVWLHGVTEKMTMSGSDGRFSFENLPEGTAMMTAQKPGYFNSQEAGGNSGPIPSLKIGKESPEAKILLYPTGSISGHVTSATGDPIEGTMVHVIYRHVINGEARWEQRNMATTDSAGAYRLTDLVPGKYVVATSAHSVRVLSPGVRPFGASFDLVYPPLYFSGSPDRSGAIPVQVAPGQTAEADFSEPTARGYSISGVVTGGEEKRMMLTLLDHEGNPVMAHANRQENRFSFSDVVPGEYSVLVSATAQNNSPLYGIAPVAVSGADVEGVAIEVSRAANIPIQVEWEKPPASGATASTNTPAPVRVHLVPVGENQMHHDYFWQASSGAPDTIQGVMPGAYRVTVATGTQAYVASLRSGQTDLMGNHLVVTSGAAAAPIQIALRPGGATVSGTLKTEQPLASAVFILVIPDSASPMELNIFSSTAQFSASGLAPGAYHIYAFPSIEGLEFGNRETMQRFDNQAVSVNLTENETKQIELPVITGGGQP
jgi:hypothetical protein